jgi:hypothetical protein
MSKIASLVTNYKPLKEYSHAELIQFLNKNETQDANVLACICSEILRREYHSRDAMQKNKD